MAKKQPPLHDWICDGCGKKIYKRRKPPKRRCHGYPLRPLGSPWKYVTQQFYESYKPGTGRGSALPDDYWISEKVLARLQEIVEERGSEWTGSCRSKGPHEAEKYEDLP